MLCWANHLKKSTNSFQSLIYRQNTSTPRWSHHNPFLCDKDTDDNNEDEDSLQSRCFLFFSRRRDWTSERASGGAKEHACGEKKTGRSGEGMSKKGEGWEEEESFARLTPSPCSLFLALSRSFVPFACFLETPATQGRMKTANFIKALNDWHNVNYHSIRKSGLQQTQDGTLITTVASNRQTKVLSCL